MEAVFDVASEGRVTAATRRPGIHTRYGGISVACLLLCLLAAPAQAQEVAARVQFLVGDVTATSPDGQLRILQKGDRVYSGETIRTGEEASAQLIYRDRSRMAVRVNTEFTIREYSYDEGNQSESKSIFSLLSGALRTVTGLIGKANRNNVTIDTPNATIGIRGTDHEVVHIVQQSSQLAQAGTYNKVYVGATVMRTPQGNLNLELRQAGFVGGTPGNPLKPVKIVDLPKAITDQIINKIPLQARIQPKQADTSKAPARTTKKKLGSTTTKTRRLDSAAPKTLDSTIKLDTSTTLQKTYDASKTLDPSFSTGPLDSKIDKTLESTTIKSLDPALSTTIQTDTLRSTIISPTTTDSLKSTITSPTTTDSLKSTIISPTTTESLKSTITSPTKIKK